MVSGDGFFFDGMVSTRHSVTVEAAPDMLRVRDAAGTALAAWPYNELQSLPAPDETLRLGRLGSAVLARIETAKIELGEAPFARLLVAARA